MYSRYRSSAMHWCHLVWIIDAISAANKSTTNDLHTNPNTTSLSLSLFVLLEINEIFTVGRGMHLEFIVGNCCKFIGIVIQCDGTLDHRIFTIRPWVRWRWFGWNAFGVRHHDSHGDDTHEVLLSYAHERVPLDHLSAVRQCQKPH